LLRREQVGVADNLCASGSVSQILLPRWRPSSLVNVLSVCSGGTIRSADRAGSGS
jgi:hypothetical protein